MARKVIGMGESTMDIIFKKNRPQAAVPGGSCFNSCVSLGRAGVDVSFMGTTGNDRIGHDTVRFLEENGVDTTFYELSSRTRSSLSLAYLDENNDADYLFYKYPPLAQSSSSFPVIGEGDVLLLGSYYAICDEVRTPVLEMLDRADRAGAVIYYDINFRRSRLSQLDSLMPRIMENASKASVVRGSADDFEIIFGMRDALSIYETYFRDVTKVFICTSGADGIVLCCPSGTYAFSVPKISTVSCVGAGDNFNAGFIYGLFREGISREQMAFSDSLMWSRLMEYAISFSSDVCRSEENYISREFSEKCRAVS